MAVNFAKRIGSEEPIYYFLLRGIITLGCFTLPMRTVRRLRLRYLLLRPGYPNPNGFHIPDSPVAL